MLYAAFKQILTFLSSMSFQAECFETQNFPLTLSCGLSLSASSSLFCSRYELVDRVKTNMSSVDASKGTYNQSSEKFLPTGTNHTSPNASTSSTRTTEISINGNSYVNTPSPSSIASSSTMEHPLRYRPCSSRSKWRTSLLQKIYTLDFSPRW